MIDPAEKELIRPWARLGAALAFLGGFTLFLFNGVGGTDYEVAYLAAATLGAGLLLIGFLCLRAKSKPAAFPLPRLHPWIAFAILATLAFFLLF